MFYCLKVFISARFQKSLTDASKNHGCDGLKLNDKINSCNVPETRARMRQECKNIKKQVNRKVKEAEENEIDRQMKHLEQISDDNTKYYYVLRSLQNSKKNNKSSMLVNDKEGNFQIIEKCRVM